MIFIIIYNIMIFIIIFQGAFYFFVPLPSVIREGGAVAFLAESHGILVTPGERLLLLLLLLLLL